MSKFAIDNSTDKSLKLVIESWADLEILAPKGRAEFEYSEPADLLFALRQDGAIVVEIMSDNIKVTANGGEKSFKPPGGWEGQ